jgi:hypothetical protein
MADSELQFHVFDQVGNCHTISESICRQVRNDIFSQVLNDTNLYVMGKVWPRVNNNVYYPVKTAVCSILDFQI